MAFYDNSNNTTQRADGIASNSCFVYLPNEGEIYDYFQVPAHELELIKLMIAYWKADYIRLHHHTNEILPPFTDEKLLQAIKDNAIHSNT